MFRANGEKTKETVKRHFEESFAVIWGVYSRGEPLNDKESWTVIIHSLLINEMMGIGHGLKCITFHIMVIQVSKNNKYHPTVENLFIRQIIHRKLCHL